MMYAVADHRHESDQQADNTGGREQSPPTAPTPHVPPAVTGTPHLPAPTAGPGQPDPEQLRLFREFQQFQRFQEFQRAQQAGLLPPADQPPQLPPTDGRQLQPAGSRELMPQHDPPAEPPRKRRAPAWLVSLGGKIVGALLMLAAIIVGAGLAIDYFLTSDPVTPAEHAQQGGRKAEGTKLYASSPYEAVRRIYDDVAQGATEDICLRFDEAARSQFAAAFKRENCADAAADLHARVTNADAYAESLPSNVSNPSLGDEIEIDSCQVGIAPGGVVGGPALGVFTVSKIPDAEGEQWLITRYVPGPEKCPKKS